MIKMTNSSMTPDEAVEIARLFCEEFKVPYECKITDSLSYLGQCDCYKKEIRISKFFLECYSYQQSLDTIRHELAHALSPHAEQHGKIWKENFLLVGGCPRQVLPYSRKRRDYRRDELIISWDEYCNRWEVKLKEIRRERGKQLAACRMKR